MRVRQGFRKRLRSCAKPVIERQAENTRAKREGETECDRKSDGMKDHVIRVLRPPRADRSSHRGGDAAADAAGGHHRHQHPDREDDRDANKRVRAEKADIVSLRYADHRDSWQRKTHQRRHNGARQHRAATGRLGVDRGRLNLAVLERGLGHVIARS
jgi:hypothetical protein